MYSRLIKHIIIILIVVACGVLEAAACTSMVVSARASASGRPMLWKHRDTGADHNFIDRVPAQGPDELSYVGLFNGGDSLYSEAWMGMNDCGFAIMNTASYNLVPDTAKLKDREGVLMAMALKKCRTVDDFRNMLDSLPRPMGVQANFGVIDAHGRAAYFETWDDGFIPYYIGGDGEPTAMIRTNFSVAGNDSTGMGYIRYENAQHLLGPTAEAATLSPDDFLAVASCSYWHSMMERDPYTDGDIWAIDQDFIPRRSSMASVVIEGCDSTGNPSDMLMHAIVGYPPLGDVHIATLSEVPEPLRPTLPGFRCRACEETQQRMRQAFPIQRGSGPRYLNLDVIRQWRTTHH